MKAKHSILILLFMCMMILQSAHAEYRVYQFSIKHKNPYSLDTKTHIVTSTLNPTSYIAYHGGGDTLTIDLMRTWMCEGNTAHRKVCKPPILQATDTTGVN